MTRKKEITKINKERNNNGKRTLGFSMLKNRIITNTYTPQIYKFTKKEWLSNELSIINYLLV